MNNDNSPQENEQDTIFSENEFSNIGYDKHIRQARNTLFIIAALTFISAVYVYAMTNIQSGYILAGSSALFSMIFFMLGLWTKKKPYTAIITALIIYIGLWALDCFIDPSYIFKGLIIKIAIIIYLVKGLSDAKEAQQMKGMIN